MIRAEPSINRNNADIWFGKYCTGRFWHTVRNAGNGRATNFRSESAAVSAARNEWWRHVRAEDQQRM